MGTADGLQQLLYPHGEFRTQVLVAMVRHRWFINVRWVITVVAAGLLQAERIFVPIFSRPAGLFVCIFVLGVINVVWTVVARRLCGRLDDVDRPEGESVRAVTRFANAQMLVDLLLLTLILRFSGGVENPMSIFYLFHTLIAALLLRPLNALVQGIWAVALYALLGFGECTGQITPHYPFLMSVRDASPHEDPVYVALGVAVLALGLLGTLYFTLQISSRLDDQERRLEETNVELWQSQQRIRLLQDRRSRFMQTAAHQLKSPVTGIEMLADLLYRDAVPEDKVRPTLARIVRRCREAIVGVTELLTLARVQDAAFARHAEAETDVRHVLNEVVTRYQEHAAARGVSMELDPGGEAEPIYACVDERDLDDCVANLVDNAIKYSRAGGTVRVTGGRKGGCVSIEVRDDGIGIAREELDNVFEPYRRGNNALSSGIPGTGLGLAIVATVVEQAGGRIDLKSEIGKGTTITLWFRCGRRHE